MNCKSSLAVFILVFLINTSLFSEGLPKSFKLDHITAADGLPHISVSAILQDSRGLIWLGTQGGLASYDGYDFTVQEHDPFSDNTLNHNLIQTMFLDGDNTIWIGTYDGLAHYYPTENRFVQYKHDKNRSDSLSDSVVVSILRDSRGFLWVGTLNGLNRMEDEKEGTFRRYYPDEKNPLQSLPHKVIRTIYEDSEKRLWFGSYGGLSLFNYPNETFNSWNTETHDTFPGNTVMCIKEDARNPGELWMGIWDQGLVKFNPEQNSIEQFPLPDNRIYTMMFDSGGTLWTGTWGGGLIRYNLSLGTYTHHRQEDDNFGLKHNTVYSLFEDNSGIVWIGTNGGGINQYARWKNLYKHFIGSNKPGSLHRGKVYSLLKDENETLWAGVYNGGLHKLPRGETSFINYSHDPGNPESLSNDIVNVIYKDSDSNLWIGTNKGLNLLNENTGQFTLFKVLPDDIPMSEEIIYCMTEDSGGRLWIGTYTNGAVLYNPKTEKISYFSTGSTEPLSDNLVRYIYEDKEGLIWLGTNNGLNQWNPEKKMMKQYLHDSENAESISNNNIRQIKEDNEGNLWICTNGGGASLYNRDTDSFTHLTTKDGLISNILTGIEIRKTGEIWFISSYGVSIYSTLNRSFVNMPIHSVFTGDELSQGHMTDRHNNIYLGNNIGFSIIPDSRITSSHWKPDLYFTDLKVMGNSIEKSRWLNGDLTLKADENYLTFNFAMNDYSRESMKRYSYKMEGVDTEWIPSGKRHRVSYSNLAPGRYELKIRGAGRTGVWSDTEKKISVTILPHFWQSRFSKIMYALLLLLLLLSIILFIKKRQAGIESQLLRKEEANRELEEKVRLRTRDLIKAKNEAEKALHTKSMFLANMSHEVRTPLNGILGMTSLLGKTELSSEQKKFLDYTKISADNLLSLVNDILDIERINSGKIKLENDVFSLKKTLSYLSEIIMVQAEKKQIIFCWDFDSNLPEALRGDSVKFLQILSNILGNSVKYTESGSINFSARMLNPDNESARAELEFIIADTGIGIPEDKQKAVFEIFEQVDASYAKQYQGAGLGLAISKKLTELMNGSLSMKSREGEGTVITIILPFETDETTQKDTEVRIQVTREETSARILLAEDELINRFYMKKTLENLGIDSEVAVNGSDAVALTEKNHYDLILMDINMPVMSGIEAVKRIRKDQKNRHTPVIALTAHAMKEEIEKCREAGMDDYIIKPVDEDSLFRKIRYWLS